jgi:hypothetical protein
VFKYAQTVILEEYQQNYACKDAAPFFQMILPIYACLHALLEQQLIATSSHVKEDVNMDNLSKIKSVVPHVRLDFMPIT